MNNIHPDLIAIQQVIYQPCNMLFSQVEPEPESQDYGACTFDVDGAHVKFRVAKITPKKVGQFVTFWKRKNDGPIQPFDVEDDFQFLVVSVRFRDRFGQFVFPKHILLQYGILAHSGKGGKRALRVYPPWDQTTNRQAQKTQEWQLAYFQEIKADAATETKATQTRSSILYCRDGSLARQSISRR